MFLAAPTKKEAAECPSSPVDSRFPGLLAALVLVSGADAPPKPPAPAQNLPVPERIGQETRAEIKTRMGLHAVTMQNLVRSVVLLDRPTVRALANRIADEEMAARSGALREERYPSLPRQFFVEQDELGTTARQLAAAAMEGGMTGSWRSASAP